MGAFHIGIFTSSRIFINYIRSDSRLEPQAIDLEFMNWCGSMIPQSFSLNLINYLVCSSEETVFHKRNA